MKGLKHLMIGLAVVLAPNAAATAESVLLNGVKSNPREAKAMCQDFRDQNQRGKSAYDPSTTSSVAQSRQISRPDAEVLITYVVGIHCPDVR